MSISGNAVIIKKISLPATWDAGAGRIDHLGSQAQHPYPYEETHVDYAILKPPPGSEDRGLEILLVAVKKEEWPLTNVINQAKKNLVAIGVDAFALFNAFEINYPEEFAEKSVAITVSLGANVTTMWSLIHGIPQLFREPVHRRDVHHRSDPQGPQHRPSGGGKPFSGAFSRPGFPRRTRPPLLRRTSRSFSELKSRRRSPFIRPRTGGRKKSTRSTSAAAWPGWAACRRRSSISSKSRRFRSIPSGKSIIMTKIGSAYLIRTCGSLFGVAVGRNDSANGRNEPMIRVNLLKTDIKAGDKRPSVGVPVAAPVEIKPKNRKKSNAVNLIVFLVIAVLK